MNLNAAFNAHKPRSRGLGCIVYVTFFPTNRLHGKDLHNSTCIHILGIVLTLFVTVNTFKRERFYLSFDHIPVYHSSVQSPYYQTSSTQPCKESILMLPIEAIMCPVYFFSLCEVKSVSMVFSVFLAKICILYRSVLLKSYGGEGMGKEYVT